MAFTPPLGARLVTSETREHPMHIGALGQRLNHRFKQ